MTDADPSQACKGLSWTIDAWSNLTAQTTTAGTCYSFQAAVGTNNQLQTGYQYDAAGNLTFDGSHHYSYDAENRIIQVDGGSTSYVYNENGKRVRKSTGTTWTEYFYGPNGVQAEYNGTWPVQYIYAGCPTLRVSRFPKATTTEAAPVFALFEGRGFQLLTRWAILISRTAPVSRMQQE